MAIPMAIPQTPAPLDGDPDKDAPTPPRPGCGKRRVNSVVEQQSAEALRMLFQLELDMDAVNSGFVAFGVTAALDRHQIPPRGMVPDQIWVSAKTDSVRDWCNAYGIATRVTYPISAWGLDTALKLAVGWTCRAEYFFDLWDRGDRRRPYIYRAIDIFCFEPPIWFQEFAEMAPEGSRLMAEIEEVSNFLPTCIRGVPEVEPDRNKDGFIARDPDPALVAGLAKIPCGTTDFRVRAVNAAWPKLVFDADGFKGAPGSVEARTFLKSYTFGQSATYSVKLYGLVEAKTMAYIWCEKVQYAFNIFWTDGRTHLDNARLASWTPLPDWEQLLESYHLAGNERAYRRLDSLLRPGERRPRARVVRRGQR